MQVTRRMLLASAAPAMSLVLMGGTCLPNFQAQWAAAVGAIQTAVAKYAGYIPAVESIVAEAAALFGPQYSAIVAVGSAALNQVIAVLVQIVNNLSPPASAKLHARLKVSSPNVPVTIGTTPQGIVVVGFRV